MAGDIIFINDSIKMTKKKKSTKETNKFKDFNDEPTINTKLTAVTRPDYCTSPCAWGSKGKTH